MAKGDKTVYSVFLYARNREVESEAEPTPLVFVGESELFLPERQLKNKPLLHLLASSVFLSSCQLNALLVISFDGLNFLSRPTLAMLFVDHRVMCRAQQNQILIAVEQLRGVRSVVAWAIDTR